MKFPQEGVPEHYPTSCGPPDPVGAVISFSHVDENGIVTMKKMRVKCAHRRNDGNGYDVWFENHTEPFVYRHTKEE